MVLTRRVSADTWVSAAASCSHRPDGRDVRHSAEPAPEAAISALRRCSPAYRSPGGGGRTAGRNRRCRPGFQLADAIQTSWRVACRPGKALTSSGGAPSAPGWWRSRRLAKTSKSPSKDSLSKTAQLWYENVQTFPDAARVYDHLLLLRTSIDLSTRPTGRHLGTDFVFGRQLTILVGFAIGIFCTAAVYSVLVRTAGFVVVLLQQRCVLPFRSEVRGVRESG